jgi:hypothetical protein
MFYLAERDDYVALSLRERKHRVRNTGIPRAAKPTKSIQVLGSGTAATALAGEASGVADGS